MTKLNILIFGLILSYNIQSQNYVPLVIDSLHSKFWGVGFEGESLDSESWAGYSYDLNYDLTQLRYPTFRYNYSYGTDTVYLLAESIDINNNWNISSRSTTAYHQQNVVSKLTEIYTNSDFVNSALHTYFFKDTNQDTLYLLQHWRNDAWVNFYKKEKIFNEKGQLTKEADYCTNINF